MTHSQWGGPAPVGEAVLKGFEELVGGVVVHDDPLAHGQGLGCGSGNDIALAGVDKRAVLVHAGIQVVARPVERHVQPPLAG